MGLINLPFHGLPVQRGALAAAHSHPRRNGRASLDPTRSFNSFENGQNVCEKPQHTTLHVWLLYFSKRLGCFFYFLFIYMHSWVSIIFFFKYPAPDLVGSNVFYLIYLLNLSASSLLFNFLSGLVSIYSTKAKMLLLLCALLLCLGLSKISLKLKTIPVSEGSVRSLETVQQHYSNKLNSTSFFNICKVALQTQKTISFSYGYTHKEVQVRKHPEQGSYLKFEEEKQLSR